MTRREKPENRQRRARECFRSFPVISQQRRALFRPKLVPPEKCSPLLAYHRERPETLARASLAVFWFLPPGRRLATYKNSPSYRTQVSTSVGPHPLKRWRCTAQSTTTPRPTTQSFTCTPLTRLFILRWLISIPMRRFLPSPRT